jgi:hypothetical protein
MDQKMRTLLLANLKRFHLNSEPLKGDAILTDEASQDILKAFPASLKQFVLGSFLDAKAMNKLSQTTRRSSAIYNQLVAHRLACFNPHFVFEEPLLNTAMLAVLEKHFPKSPNLNSDTIHDELQYLIINFNYNDLSFQTIPKIAYFYLIAFINEAVYGVDSKVPLTYGSLVLGFPRLLRLYNLPDSYYLMLAKLATKGRCCFWNDMDYEKNMKFFFDKPTKETVKEYFKITDINTWSPYSGLHESFIIAMNEFLIDEYSDERIIQMFDQRLYYNFPPSMFMRYFSIMSKEALLGICKDIDYFRKSKKFACMKLKERFGIELDECQVFTRTSLSIFPDRPVILEDLIFPASCSICDFDKIPISINSKLLSPAIRRQAFLDLHTREYNMFVVEQMIKESTEPISFFVLHSDKLRPLPLSRLLASNDFNIAVEFAASSSDPLIWLLLVKSYNFYHVKTFSSLDLNKIYRFDKEIIYFSKEFIGRTIHFKQILKEMNNSQLQEYFGIDSSELEEDYSLVDDSLPVIVVDENFTFQSV